MPGLGNLMGGFFSLIAFIFTSDGSITNKGSFVDDVVLQKLVNTVSCPNQYKAEYFNNRTLRGSLAVTLRDLVGQLQLGVTAARSVESAATTSRCAGAAQQAFQRELTRLSLPTTVSEAWLDNVLIIDAWRDQAETLYRAMRSVTAGSHALKVEYYENGGGATAKFRGWQASKKKVSIRPWMV